MSRRPEQTTYKKAGCQDELIATRAKIAVAPTIEQVLAVKIDSDCKLTLLDVRQQFNR